MGRQLSQMIRIRGSHLCFQKRNEYDFHFLFAHCPFSMLIFMFRHIDVRFEMRELRHTIKYVVEKKKEEKQTQKTAFTF